MKNLKIFITLFSLVFSISATQVQSKVKVPNELHGFWHFSVDNPGDWDGTLIGSDYVEFFYQLYYVEKIEAQDDNGYRLWLKHENGNTLELVVSELGEKQAKLQFSEWDSPKLCQLLDSIRPIPKKYR